MMGVTSRADEFAKNAEHAKRAVSPLDRDSYNRIAQGWRELERSARLTEKRGL